jgi:hypothetical protein
MIDILAGQIGGGYQAGAKNSIIDILSGQIGVRLSGSGKEQHD